MTGRLVGARIQAHVQHHGTLILGHNNVEAAERVRHVVAEEGGLELLEDVDTVSLELESFDRGGDHREHHALAGNVRARELVGKISRVIEDSERVGDEVSLGLGRAGNNLIREQSEVMPVTVLVRVGRADVDHWAKTAVDGLNGPLEVRQQHVVGAGALAIRLEAVHADERETDTADVDVVHLGVDEDVVDVQLNVLNLLSGVNRRVVGQSRGDGDPLVGGLHLSGGRKTGSGRGGDLLLDSEAEEQIAGGDEENVGLVLNVNLNETLTVGDRHGGDRQARILVKPEDAIWHESILRKAC